MTRASLILTIAFLLAACSPGWEIVNPYSQVDWAEHGQYKANLHAHTTRSDGRLNPQTVVDLYHELGYDILAITDHNLVTHPWTSFSDMGPSERSRERLADDPDSMPQELVFQDRDPEELGMIDIQANELSRHDHMGSFFNDHEGPAYGVQIAHTITEEESLEAVAARDGILMIYHPGRYDRAIDWYVDLFNHHHHVVGVEVYNQGDRYPDDRLLWDSILTRTLPERQVWAYSNDDMHIAEHIGRNWNMFILPELSHEAVRRGMEEGLSYFVYAPEGHEGPIAPSIEAIRVDSRRGTIDIIARDYERIVWIAEGRPVHEGGRISLGDLPEEYAYVRAKIHGAGNSVAGTQAFGIREYP